MVYDYKGFVVRQVLYFLLAAAPRISPLLLLGLITPCYQPSNLP